MQAKLKLQRQDILLWMLYSHVQNGDGSKAASCYEALTAATDEPGVRPPTLALYISALAMQGKLRVGITSCIPPSLVLS